MNVIAVDWGSSSFRAYLLDENDQLIETCRNNNGVLNLKTPFIEVLTQACQKWLQDYSVERIILAGAIGSREGWVETEYAPHTSLLNDYINYAKEIETNLDCKVEILPGLKGVSPGGSADVMRGEEVQLMGLIPQLTTSETFVCIPGTHSKWLHIRDGQIQSFTTFITGELFALLQQKPNSIGNLIHSKKYDQSAFIQGAQEQLRLSAESMQSVSLLHSLFSMRAMLLTNKLQTASEYSYISGMLMVNEIECAKALFNIQQEVMLVSDGQLVLPYESGLNLCGLKVQSRSSEDCFIDGIIKFKNQKN